MTKFAEIIELTEEEAEYLGYDHDDPISMVKNHNGFIIYRKGSYLESHIENTHWGDTGWDESAPGIETIGE